MTTSSSRTKGTKLAIEAAIEDYVKTGMNICIGDGNKNVLIALLDAIDTRVEAEGLIDVAFVGASPVVKALIEERELPSDMSVNFKRDIDLFIVPISRMDNDCNAVLDTDDISANRYAASAATSVVLIIHDDDLRETVNGLESIPVQLSGFMPETAAQSLCSSNMLDFGVRGATLREDESHIADVSLAKNAVPSIVDSELKRLETVQAVGLLPASSKTTAVVATANAEPIDITSTVHSLRNLPDDRRSAKLDSKKRETALDILKKWRVIEGQQEALLRAFTFKSTAQANAFVRYVHDVSSGARHDPEIKQTYGRVQICLTTYEAGGISELDAMFAQEISRVYDNIQMTKPETSA